jgi:hypothetical protein
MLDLARSTKNPVTESSLLPYHGTRHATLRRTSRTNAPLVVQDARILEILQSRTGKVFTHHRPVTPASNVVSASNSVRALLPYCDIRRPHSMRLVENTSPTDVLRSQLRARFHGPLISFFLRRIRDRCEAEDMAQDVLLRIIRHSGIEQIEHAESYVLKIAVNLLRDRGRHALRTGAQKEIHRDFLLQRRDDNRCNSCIEDAAPARS